MVRAGTASVARTIYAAVVGRPQPKIREASIVISRAIKMLSPATFSIRLENLEPIPVS